MSTDTDYVITIKGKDAALRKAAADFIELALNPWNPQRNDKKTLTRLDVFRNESNCAGFFTPSSLCEEAAKLFPGAHVSFSSKDEYGYTEEGEWSEKGKAPGNAEAVVAEKVFERVRTEVEHPRRRVKWLTPLAAYCAQARVVGKLAKKIQSLVDEANAEETAKAKRKANALSELESCVRWTFSPVLLTNAKCIAKVGRSSVLLAYSGQDSEDNPHISYEHCPAEELPSKRTSWFEEEPWSKAILLRFDLKLEDADSGELLRWDARKESDVMSFSEGRPRLFIRSAKGVRTTDPVIDTNGKDFFWTFAQVTSDPDEKDAEVVGKALECVGKQETLWRISEGFPFAHLWPHGLAADSSSVFVATCSTHRKNKGQIIRISLADGAVVWASKADIQECKALCLSGEDDVIAAITTGASDTMHKGGEILCLERKTGKERWRVPFKPSRLFELASTDQTAVLLSFDAEDSSLLLVDIATGQVAATLDQASTKGAKKLCVDSNRIYLLNPWNQSTGQVATGEISAFDYNGSLLWSCKLPTAAYAMSLTGNGSMLLSLGEDGVIAVDCSSGKTIWHVANEETQAECVTGDGGLGFFAGFRRCTARKVSDGSSIWETDFADDVVIRALAITREAIVVKTDDSVVLLDPASGTVNRTLGLACASRMVVTPDGAFCCLGTAPSYPGSQETLFCLNLGGKSPLGSWPMERGNSEGGSFLPGKVRPGYKDFIKAWKDGENLSQSLAKFSPAPDSDKAREARIHGIIRGHELITQARSWVEPSIGSGKTATARGAQWRLVMAYGGFELLAKSLTATKGGGLEENTLSGLIGKLSLPNFDALVPPSIDKSSLKQWMEEEDASDVLDFLKMENGDRSRFDAWLGKQKPITEWTDALLLAKAFRNATAHGALSPSKLEEWKLGEVVSRLTEEILRIDEAIFEVLGQAREIT